MPENDQVTAALMQVLDILRRLELEDQERIIRTACVYLGIDASKLERVAR